MDGGQSVQLVDDVVYEIEPGLHLFEVHSTSDSARRTGSITSAVNSFVGTDGVLGAINRASARNAIGDTWSFQVNLDDDDMLSLSVRSQGNSILGDPQYEVGALSEEQVEYIKNFLAESQAKEAAEQEERRKAREKAREEERMRPRRSTVKILLGLIIAFWSTLFAIVGIDLVMATGELPLLLIGCAGLVLGIVLFILGMIKKVRK